MTTKPQTQKLVPWLQSQFVPLSTALILGACTGAELVDDSEATETETETETDGDTGDDTDDNGEPGEPTLVPSADIIVQHLDTHCVKCHGPANGAGGLSDITNLEKMIAENHILPNDPANSPIFARLTSSSNPMPPNTEERPPDDVIADIQVWIQEGALTGDNACDNPVIPFDNANDGMIASMRNDILELEEEDRPFIRYLTLTHLYNSGLCDRDMDLYRDGLAKAVNSLSRRPELVRPKAIDAERTIYRIDLRDYGWENNPNFLEFGRDVWEAVADANPFAVRFRGLASDTLRLHSGTEIPFQPADSFIQIATGGLLEEVDPALQFYTRIAQIPQTLTELTAEVTDADLEQEILTGNAFRVILENSGVSQWNRAYDRYIGKASGQYYYISHDFASSSGEANLFANPIQFVPAGGEMIFTLANGLQGYMITEGDDSISEAPTNVVNDPGQPDGVVRVGISCMACHNNGIITKKDDFYDFYQIGNNKNLFPTEDHELIERLFGDPDAAVERQDADVRRFQLALTELDINIENPEPIIHTSWRFRDAVTLTRFAAEVGLSEDTIKFDIKRLQDRVDRNFGQLVASGSLSRDFLATNFKSALCLLLKNSKEEPDEPECDEFEEGSEDSEDSPEDSSGDSSGTDSDDAPTSG